MRSQAKLPQRMSTKNLARALLGAVVALAAITVPTVGQSTADEYRVKSAFLFHFVQLVDWPEDALGGAGNPLTMCTLGEDPFHGALESTTEGRTVSSRAVRVRHAKQSQELKGCQLIFIGSAEGKDTGALLALLKNDPVLTIGESEGFLEQGGVIRLFIEENKVRFEVDLDTAQRARLKISSRLLLLAKRVIGKGKQG